MSDYDDFTPKQWESYRDPYDELSLRGAVKTRQSASPSDVLQPDYDSLEKVAFPTADYDISQESFEQVELKSAPVAESTRKAPFAGPRRPLRLAFIGPPLTIGGVDQHTRGLAKFFDRDVIRATKYLIVQDHGGRKGDDHDRGLPVQYCDPSDIPQATKDCDVVLIWGAGFNKWLKGCKAIKVFLAHGESGWTRRCLESSSQVVDHVVAVSQRVKRQVCDGFPTTVILNGVDAARLASTRARRDSRARYGFRDDEFVVGSLGRFTREKRVDLLIETVAQLPECFKLLVVGYGRRRLELLELANTCLPGRYALVSADDYLGDYYGCMDAFALLSAHEGFGLVIPEAMLCSCPVIATNVGCVPEVIQPNVSGIVVEPDTHSIAAAIRRLHQHPAWAKGIATEAHEFASRHLHAARMAREYESLLCQLADRGKAFTR